MLPNKIYCVLEFVAVHRMFCAIIQEPEPNEIHHRYVPNRIEQQTRPDATVSRVAHQSDHKLSNFHSLVFASAALLTY